MSDSIDVIRDLVEVLAVNLACWADRDDSQTQPTVRQAANDALGAIDGALRELHQVRQWLVAEMRRSDDEFARRLDAELTVVHIGPTGPASTVPVTPPTDPAERARWEAAAAARAAAGLSSIVGED